MRSRGFCFTINNYTDEDLAFCMDQETLQYRYILCGFEVGDEEGTPHIQGYVYYDNPRSFNSIKKLFYPNHIELQKGSFKEATDYCKGLSAGKVPNEDVYEQGEAPHPGQVDKAKIEDIMNDPWNNFHLYNQYRRSYRELINKQLKNHERHLCVHPRRRKYEWMAEGMRSYCIYPSDYEDEEYYFVPASLIPYWVEDWINGLPHKQKVGYEYRYIDPQYVIIETESDEPTALEKSHINNYIDYIDIWPDTDLTGEDDIEDDQ